MVVEKGTKGKYFRRIRGFGTHRLPVIENWNRANTLMLSGKDGEFASHTLEG